MSKAPVSRVRLIQVLRLTAALLRETSRQPIPPGLRARLLYMASRLDEIAARLATD